MHAFRVIVVTDPPTNTQIRKHTDWTDYNRLHRSLARSVINNTKLSGEATLNT